MHTTDRPVIQTWRKRRALVALMAGLLFTSTVHAGQAIEGAFGLVLGARFDRFGFGASGTGPELMWFEFAAPASMPVLKRFRALVSPISYRIHSILAEDPLGDPAVCRDWAAGVFATVAEKYQGDEHGTRMYGRDDRSAFELEQLKLSRRIVIVCSPEGDLSMSYEDRVLRDKARAEHQEWNRLTEDLRAGRHAAAAPRLAELAAQGHMHSEFLLGYAHRRGLGVERDNVKAEALYQRAAAKGMLEAQYNLGTFELERGRLAAAQPWLLKAAERGMALAQENLAQLYLRPGALYDEATAFGWFLKAAEAGRVEAQYNTCHMYSAGDGVKRDDVQAWRWCDIAATSGHEKAARNRDHIAQRMTPPQLEQARQLSSQWLDTHRKP